jgi:hypothetical protein
VRHHIGSSNGEDICTVLYVLHSYTSNYALIVVRSNPTRRWYSSHVGYLPLTASAQGPRWRSSQVPTGLEIATGTSYSSVRGRSLP